MRMRMQRLSGRIYIRELLDLVGAIGKEPKALEDAVRHMYDWHNGRSVTGMQLTFAPAATAVLAFVAKPNSTAAIIVASTAVFVMLVVGVALLLQLNCLHGEYALAARLTTAVSTFHAELARYPHGVGARPGSRVHLLYEKIGSTSLVEYRRCPQCRERVLRVLSECGQRAKAEALR